MSVYQGPYYRYDLGLLEETIQEANKVAERENIQLKYALKANQNKEIVGLIKENNLGIDAVSKEEIAFALEMGWSPSAIVFAGSGKTLVEIDFAIANSIAYIHCESVEEYQIIKSIKRNYPNSNTAIALRINPNLKVGTHQKISTGEKKHKFGIAFEEALEIISNDYSISGLHFHVGSQIEDLAYFEDLSLLVRSFIDKLPEDYSLNYLNLGGGIGIDYNQPEVNPIPDFSGWMSALRKHLPQDRIKVLTLEPGRSIVGQCGKLIGQVQYIKNKQTNFAMAILDVGMTELLRPAMYGAKHAISIPPTSSVYKEYMVCGPSCESSDSFGDDYFLPELNTGDIVTIHSCGAYGESMRLSYNLKKRIPSFYVRRKNNTCFKRRDFSLAS